MRLFKRTLKFAALVAIVLLVIGGVWVYRLALVLMPSKQEMVKYNATNEENLKTLRTAFMEYHESEGQFPDASKWMDEIESRIQENDMTTEETAKKLVNPLYPPGRGVYGYAMNDAASDKYKGDLKPFTVLIFDSSDTSWNAHGKTDKLVPRNPARGGDEGITLDGRIVKLPSK